MKHVLERIPLYIQYYLLKVDEHSLQGPFAFDFYKNVIQKSKTDPDDTEIEKVRKQLQNSPDNIDYYSHGEDSSLNAQSRKSISKIAKHGISSPSKSILFKRIIEENNCKNIVELGTSVGLNAAYLAKAHPQGKVITMEGHPELISFSKKLFENLSIRNIRLIEGNIDDQIKSIHDYFDEIDFVFIDANHKSTAILQYYRSLSSAFTDRTIVVVDDIRWSKDMYFGWKQMNNENNVSHSFDLGEIGILIHKSTSQKQHYILNY